MAERSVPFLDIRVEEVMTPNPRSIEPDAPLSDAARKMMRGGFRHLPVVDTAGRLVGMLSERDLRGKLGTAPEDFPNATLDSLAQSVASVMTPDPISICPGARLGEALGVYADERVGALPVVDEGDELVGILSYVDVLVFLKTRAEEEGEGSDLPPRSEAPRSPGPVSGPEPAQPPTKKLARPRKRGGRAQRRRKTGSSAARHRRMKARR